MIFPVFMTALKDKVCRFSQLVEVKFGHFLRLMLVRDNKIRVIVIGESALSKTPDCSYLSLTILLIVLCGLFSYS